MEYVYVVFLLQTSSFSFTKLTHTHKKTVCSPSMFFERLFFLVCPFFFIFTRKQTHTRTQIPVTYILLFFFCISVWFICLVISWNILCGEKTKTRQNLGGIHTNKNKKKIVWTFFSLSLSTVISTILYIIYINLCV